MADYVRNVVYRLQHLRHVQTASIYFADGNEVGGLITGRKTAEAAEF